jgi:hypothetical protein
MLRFSRVADAMQLGASSFGDRRAVTTFTPFIAFSMSRFGFHNPRGLPEQFVDFDRSWNEGYYAVPCTEVQVDLVAITRYSTGHDSGHNEITETDRPERDG